VCGVCIYNSEMMARSLSCSRMNLSRRRCASASACLTLSLAGDWDKAGLSLEGESGLTERFLDRVAVCTLAHYQY
jgi:hypothetical protein